MLHCPETIGIPLAGDHQKSFRRQTKRLKARTVKPAEFERIPLPLTPENHGLAFHPAVQKRGGQSECKIPNRRLAAIAIGDQLVQSRSGPAIPCKKRVDPGRIESSQRSGGKLLSAKQSSIETVAFDHAYLPFEFGDAG